MGMPPDQSRILNFKPSCKNSYPYLSYTFFYIMNGLIAQTYLGGLTLYLIKMPFNAFGNRTDPDQAALVRAP